MLDLKKPLAVATMVATLIAFAASDAGVEADLSGAILSPNGTVVSPGQTIPIVLSATNLGPDQSGVFVFISTNDIGNLSRPFNINCSELSLIVPNKTAGSYGLRWTEPAGLSPNQTVTCTFDLVVGNGQFESPTIVMRMVSGNDANPANDIVSITLVNALLPAPVPAIAEWGVLLLTLFVAFFAAKLNQQKSREASATRQTN